MTTSMTDLSLNETKFNQLMSIKLNKKATVSDVAEVLAKKGFFGRLMVQLKLLVKGKGWVSPDLLKGLDARQLMRIEKGCGKAVVKPETFSKSAEFSDKREYTEISLDEESSGDVWWSEDSFVEISLDDDKIVPTMEVVESEQSMRSTVDKVVHKKLAMVDALGKTILKVQDDRKKKARDELSTLNKFTMEQIRANPKLETFYQKFLSKKPEGEDEDDVESFIEFLAEKMTSRNFSPLEKMDFSIGLNQLLKKDKRVKDLRNRMEIVLKPAFSYFRGQEKAEKLFKKYPEMKEMYEKFFDEYCHLKDRENGLECKSDYDGQWKAAAEKRDSVEKELENALDEKIKVSELKPGKEKDKKLLQVEKRYTKAQESLKSVADEQEELKMKVEKLPEKLSDHPESALNARNGENYPFYEEFIDRVIIVRAGSSLEECEDFFHSEIDLPVNYLLANDKHVNAMNQLSKEDSKAKAEERQHMIGMITDPGFAKKAGVLFRQMADEDEGKFSVSYEQFKNEYFEIRVHYNHEAQRGVIVGKQFVENDKFFAAMLIASGLTEKESARLMNRITQLSNQITDTNLDEWLLGNELVEDLASSGRR